MDTEADPEELEAMAKQSFLYTLRQNKFVSRGIFVDMLRHIDRFHPLRDYAYVGLGGPTLEDHKLLHSNFGMTHLVSIEMDGKVYTRQEFNRPISCISCLNKTTKEFIDNLDVERRRLGLLDAQPTITWLDFVKPSEIGLQLDELQALLANSAHGDIVRITVNAHARSLDVDGQSNFTGDELRESRLGTLRLRLGKYLPSNATQEDVQNARLPALVFAAVRRAALGALNPRYGRSFVPLLLDYYADGQQMASVTGAIVYTNEVERFLETTRLNAWEFYCGDWANHVRINIPPLTTREKLWLDREVAGQATHDTEADLPFLLGSTKETTDSISDYKRFYRFYPNFLHVVN